MGIRAPRRFLEMAREKSVTRAAMRLHIFQPTVPSAPSAGRGTGAKIVRNKYNCLELPRVDT